MLKEKMSIIKDLWSAGLHAELHLDSSEVEGFYLIWLILNSGFSENECVLSLYAPAQDLEEIQTLCRANGISHLVILKDLESTVKVCFFSAQ